MTTDQGSAPRRPSALLRWMLIVAVWGGVNVLMAIVLRDHSFAFQPQDWGLWTVVDDLIASGMLYRDGYFVWSPVAAYLMIGVVALGYPIWFALHAVSLAFMQAPRIALLTLVSLPFWADTIMGNAMVFVAVAGFAATSGSRFGSVLFLALTVLMPRPLQFPLAAWLLLRDRWLWAPTAIMTGGTIVFGLITGYLGPWITALREFGVASMQHVGLIGPTGWIGPIWYVVGLPLAIWLTHKRLFGLAGLAVTTYVGPQYLLVLLWDIPAAWRVSRSGHGQARHRAQDEEAEPASPGTKARAPS